MKTPGPGSHTTLSKWSPGGQSATLHPAKELQGSGLQTGLTFEVRVSQKKTKTQMILELSSVAPSVGDQDKNVFW